MSLARGEQKMGRTVRVRGTAADWVGSSGRGSSSGGSGVVTIGLGGTGGAGTIRRGRSGTSALMAMHVSQCSRKGAPFFLGT